MIDFNTLIDQHIYRESRPKGIGKYYPSSAGTCIRKEWYSFKYPSEIDPKLRKIFKMGDMIHDFVVEVLKSKKNPEVELLKAELPFRKKIDGITISGRVDDVIQIKSDGQIYLVEVKSTKGLQWTKEPKPHNILQLQLYMHFTGIHNGMLLYIDKTNLQSRIFEIPYDKQKAESSLDFFKKLDKHLKEDTLPPPQARLNKEMNWWCNYCEYKERCHKATPRVTKN